MKAAKTTNNQATRTETDSLGDIEVPETAYYGAQTQRSLQILRSERKKCPRRWCARWGFKKRPPP